MSVAHLPSWESGSSWFGHLQSTDCKIDARLEKIFKQLKLFSFPVKHGHRCWERFWQFGNSVDIVMKICKIVVVCQLLKSQQDLVCFDRRRGILTAELRLTGRAVLFLLSWKCTGGAVCDFLVNCCHHDVAIFWARVSRRLVVEDACFRIRITLGVVLIRSLVWAICVKGRLRSCSVLVRMSLVPYKKVPIYMYVC